MQLVRACKRLRAQSFYFHRLLFVLCSVKLQKEKSKMQPITSREWKEEKTKTVK